MHGYNVHKSLNHNCEIQGIVLLSWLTYFYIHMNMIHIQKLEQKKNKRLAVALNSVLCGSQQLL